MKIVGIDPGYERLGVAIIQKPVRGGEKLLFSSCINTDKKLSHPERLLSIWIELEKILKAFQPDVLAIETVFFNNNQKTAMAVSEAKGVLLAKACEFGLLVKEFTPIQIKMAVTGYGRAEKKQVQSMVKKMLSINKKAFDDEYDAMATALTCSATMRSGGYPQGASSPLAKSD